MLSFGKMIRSPTDSQGSLGDRFDFWRATSHVDLISRRCLGACLNIVTHPLPNASLLWGHLSQAHTHNIALIKTNKMSPWHPSRYTFKDWKLNGGGNNARIPANTNKKKIQQRPQTIWRTRSKASRKTKTQQWPQTIWRTRNKASRKTNTQQ